MPLGHPTGRGNEGGVALPPANQAPKGGSLSVWHTLAGRAPINNKGGGFGFRSSFGATLESQLPRQRGSSSRPSSGLVCQSPGLQACKSVWFALGALHFITDGPSQASTGSEWPKRNRSNRYQAGFEGKNEKNRAAIALAGSPPARLMTIEPPPPHCIVPRVTEYSHRQMRRA